MPRLLNFEMLGLKILTRVTVYFVVLLLLFEIFTRNAVYLVVHMNL